MGLILSLAFIAFVAINVPIAFSMGLASILGLLMKGNIPLVIVPQKIFTGSDSFPLLAVPFFILAGALMDTGGISLRLVNLARALVGHFRNGLGMVSIVSEIFFSGISGSTAADTAAIGSIMIPAMNQAGYTPARATAIVCAACGMGILVPPCIAMVIYGGVANVSIGALFAGRFLPALVMAAASDDSTQYSSTSGGRGAGPVARDKTACPGFQRIPSGPPHADHHLWRHPWRHLHTHGGRCLSRWLWSCDQHVRLSGDYHFKTLGDILLETGIVTGKVMIMVGMASVFAWILTREQVPQALANLIHSTGRRKGFSSSS